MPVGWDYVQVMVEAALVDQALVSFLRHNLPIVIDHNIIGIADGADALGNKSSLNLINDVPSNQR